MIRSRLICKYEFWPFWLFYVPAYINWVRLDILARYTTYFTATNPIMNNSGAINVSKFSYLSKLPAAWIPTTVKIDAKIDLNSLSTVLNENTLTFPLIIKHDRGERGKGVQLVPSLKALTQIIKSSPYSDLLLQSYCSYSNEAGILYYRYPNEVKGRISSITTKEFCVLTGDGISPWGKLIESNIRLSHRLKLLKERHADCWEIPSVKGEQKLVEPIGSHNLGTKFLSGQHLRSQSLTACLDHWADQLPGFYYGRFDIKYTSWDALLAGKEFKIIEINGVNAEPTHIYDPNHTLAKAYRDIFFHMKIIHHISLQNRSLGIAPKRLKPFLTELLHTTTRKSPTLR